MSELISATEQSIHEKVALSNKMAPIVKIASILQSNNINQWKRGCGAAHFLFRMVNGYRLEKKMWGKMD
jgi:hypothetical protein